MTRDRVRAAIAGVSSVGGPSRSSRSSRKLTLALAVTGTLGAVLVAQPAVAAPQISTRASGAAAAQTQSSYLAGYQITEPGISRASVTMTVPAMNCPSSDTQGTAEGIGNEQTAGSPTLLAVVFTACVSGSPYYAMQATAGANTSFGSVVAGDTVSILVVQTRTKVTATVNDITAAVKTTASGTPTPDNSLTFGSFPLFSGTMLPVADFGRVKMGKPYVENAQLQTWSPTILVRTNGSTTQIGTSAFNATKGSFTLIFRSN
jgi:hypothetical protein